MRILLILALSTLGFAEALCLKSTLKKNGKIKNRVRVAEVCPKGFVPLFRSDGLTSDSLVTIVGPEGPKGR